VDAGGTVLDVEIRRGGAFNWMAGLPVQDPSAVAVIEVHTTLTATSGPGTYTVGGSGVGRFSLTVDGTLLFDEAVTLPAGLDPVETLSRPPQKTAGVDLAEGASAQVVLRYYPGSAESMPIFAAQTVVIQLNVEAPYGTDDEEIAKAVDLAAQSDVAVVVVGTTEEVESEGYDRDSLALPGRQDELVRAVVAANPRTVVVVNAGSPVLLPWADEVPAVLMTWFPGQEAGNALADVLLGVVEPGGRLPVSWPRTEEHLPSTRPVDGVLTYDEGLFIGYRAYDRDGRDPHFAFGHGAGYTTWDYTGVEVVTPLVAGRDGDVQVTLVNTGERHGREVVQVYAARPTSSVQRPVRTLVGFAVVEAAPGEKATATVRVPARALQHWDDVSHAWTLEPGTVEVSAGRSSRDLRVTTTTTID
jgi:beta-glucosidase